MTKAPLKTEEISAKLSGCLLGMAVGDSLGLPREGLTRQRAAKFLGIPPLSHRFIFKHGMVSDDTEHAIMVAESLLIAGSDPSRFANELARQMRWWFLCLPAGVGLATARAIIKLWLGWSPARSGVASAGNGPAMRAPMIGVALAFQQHSLIEFVQASTRITHTDPRAEQGALLIALAAREGVLNGPVHDPASLLATWRQLVTDNQLVAALDLIEVHLSRRASAQEFADDMGLNCGVSGFINHTVPVALYVWLRYPNDYRLAVEAAIAFGGDSDTTGAIVGGLMGATLGESAIPRDLISGVTEWPRTIKWMKGLCAQLTKSITTGESMRPPGYCWPGILPRNIVFLLIVLYHGFRRLLPPY